MPELPEVHTTVEGLKGELSPRNVAQRRGKKMSDIFPKSAEEIS